MLLQKRHLKVIYQWLLSELFNIVSRVVAQFVSNIVSSFAVILKQIRSDFKLEESLYYDQIATIPNKQ